MPTDKKRIIIITYSIIPALLIAGLLANLSYIFVLLFPIILIPYGAYLLINTSLKIKIAIEFGSRIMTYIDEKFWQRILPGQLARAGKKLLEFYLNFINNHYFILVATVGGFILGIATILLGFWIIFKIFGFL